MAAEGEAPGMGRAIRTLSAPGRILKRSGGSRVIASPSTPAGTGRSESTSNSGADHSRHGRRRACDPRAGRSGRNRDPEQPVVDPGRVPEPTARPSRYRLFETSTAAPECCS